jgi:hypothetical protein
MILPFVLHGCGIWSLVSREEHRPRVFQNRVLRKIFGAKREQATGEWIKLHNEELYDLNCSPNGDQIKNEMGGAYGTHEEDERWIWGCGRET